MSHKFNLFELHSPEEDLNLRRLLRIYSLLPRFSGETNHQKIEQAEKVVKFLRQTNEELKKRVGVSWKKKWLTSTGYTFADCCVKDWLVGRASVPLIALKQLALFGLEKEIKKLVGNSEFFCSTTGAVSRAPHETSADLAYLAGAILGDGHIRKDFYKISFEVSEKWLAEKFAERLWLVFGQKAIVRNRIDRGKIRFRTTFGNKIAVRVFNKFFEIPRGKKSHIIHVPEIIKTADYSIKMAFFEGVFDTEGCITQNKLRVTSASKQFRDDLCEILSFFGEHGHKDEWLNKKYNKKYYGFQYSWDNIPFLAGVG